MIGLRLSDVFQLRFGLRLCTMLQIMAYKTCENAQGLKCINPYIVKKASVVYTDYNQEKFQAGEGIT